MNSIIPEHKQGMVKKVLRAAFGEDTIEEIQQLSKGLSGALVFKITINESPYLLRLLTREETRDKPANYFNCMQAAAEAGLAPAIYYLDIEDRICITDFIIEKKFSISEARNKMADTIRHLHTLPVFPRRINYIDVADNFFQRFKSGNILPESVTNDVFHLYSSIASVYPRNDESNLVSCHNDLKPDNIIFDGNKPWLVDWEAAFLNDRYADLAAMANFVVRSEEDEIDFLKTYFGELADEYKRARFFLMSQIIHMFCFTLCTMSVAAGKSVDMDIKTPGFREFHDRLWRGEINLGKNEEKLQYAWVHWERLKNNLYSKRFDESLHILSDCPST